jgi:DNA recombination protein RmuC
MSEIVLIGVIVLILTLWFLHHRSQQKALVILQSSIQTLSDEAGAQKSINESHHQDMTERMTDQKVANAALQEKTQQAERQALDLKQSLSEKEAVIDALHRDLFDHKSNIIELETRMAAERQAAVEKLALLDEAKAKLGNEFKLLANQIFEAKGKTFSEQNRASLDEVLKPMREQLGDFRKRVDEVHLNDAKDRASLREHLAQLEGLNRQMSEDALNLTHALKGESKAQGNWGEMILERILETSGLREGHEFLREDSSDIGGGKRHRPDVIVRMPGDKHIIIDSKVSLTNYERALSATEQADRKQAVKAHVSSFKTHIRSLSDKRYDQLPNIHSPDYVLMFVPIEGAYMMAIEADQSIFEAAFNKRVAVVTPSTLYATLKLIEQLWRYERQSENVVKLIDRASLLHDKMVSFVESFEDIGKRLNQARDSYDTALGRIKTGPGNVIGQIDTLGKLAGKTKKELPKHLTESPSLEDQTEKDTKTGML